MFSFFLESNNFLLPYNAPATSKNPIPPSIGTQGGGQQGGSLPPPGGAGGPCEYTSPIQRKEKTKKPITAIFLMIFAILYKLEQI